MITNFYRIEKASTIVLSTPLMTLAASVCDMLEKAGIPAVLDCQKGCPVVAVETQNAAETMQLLRATWTAA
jgi:hypothetical protein